MDPDRLQEALRRVRRAWDELPREEFERALDNAYLRMNLRQQYIPNRYINPQMLNVGSHGVICSVRDVFNPNLKLVAKMHWNLHNLDREKTNYSNLQALSGFAFFLDAFIMPLQNAIMLGDRFGYMNVFQYVGESLLKIVQRSLPINQRNVVTLGYKLFLIIESMHAARLVHRSIKLNHVTLQRLPNDKLSMSLIGLDEALPLDPSPMDNLDVVSQDSSPFVDDGNPYETFDDFISGVYLILRLSGINIFENTGGNFRRIGKKLPFDLESYLSR
ncbi:hypothetical protein L5515_017506 [Caenorhabditis briggsae]|uniref:Protein kinase domain-containing protein n=1 Tax=Caenorhabditis briggsae TaxID=6238 RepID=A0AAE9FDX2_CAEBR|nr:hypothetical protein L5515_017506 [Caenorhabditis briggsae]